MTASVGTITVDTSAYHHTEAQVEALTDGIRLARETYRSLMVQARKVHDSYAKAGTVNPDGSTVRHGANRDVDTVRDYLRGGACALALLAGRDYADLVNYEVGFVSNRFVTDAEMRERYGHCLAMIPGLKAKFGIADAA
jgi:hypothetical protein